MKKQFLVLTFLSLVLMFTGLNSSSGQTPIIANGSPDPYVKFLTVTDNDPVNIECAVKEVLPCAGTTDQLHPLPGQPYTYNVTTTDAAIDGSGNSTQDQIHWFVINYDEVTTGIIDPINDIDNINSIIDKGDGTGKYILSVGGSGIYNTPNQTTNEIQITWKTFNGLTDVVLLVSYVVDGTGCTDNIEVYRILPQFNFTLDIAAIDDGGNIIGDMKTSTATECVSPIESATYAESATPLSTPGTLTVDYGENWLFFTVTAANFTHSWLPSFQTTYTGTAAGITVEWAYKDQAVLSTGTWNTMDPAVNTSSALTTYTTTTPVLHSGTNTTTGTIGADNGTGECIVVRVRIDHGTANENAEPTDRTLTLAVDGVMYDTNAADATAYYTNTTTLGDLGPDTSNPTDGKCDIDNFTNDWVNYLLTPRPQVTTNTVNTAPDPDVLQHFELNTGDNNSGTLTNPNTGGN